MANVTRTLAILFFTLAVALGVFAFTLARSPDARPDRASAPGESQALDANRHLVPVVIAARDLRAGQSLDASALTVRMQAETAPGAFNDINALTGRVTRAAVAQGAPLTEDALSTGLADVVAPGERAVAVQIDETNAVGNYVRPGNFVDVFFTLKRENGGTNNDAEIASTQARLLLSKVRVLSVGSTAVGGADTNANAGANGANGVTNANAANPNIPVNRTVAGRPAVLAIRTADVDALTLAENAGRIVLALRNPDDDEAAPPQAFTPLVQTGADKNGATLAAAGVSLSALAAAHVTRERAPVRAASPAPVQRAAPRGDDIEVIRGGRVERTAS
ncbi:Flp pilus assembly protein CpaB [Caballeronia sp. BR00000012568055]|uniref:Flp pilus assembly protein CpaB n=1 Tax=Caballeronia sp. BR00000012568055 TaxID=2918761 RepID=UPI0023F73C2E|nr:Flp pilus assembly protein CpaB [Caballeronia sp. BR00000012568055]